MSQTLTLELPDKVYKAVQRAAEQLGQTPAEWVTATLVQHLPMYDAEQLRRETHPEIYELLQQLAPKLGQTTEELVVDWHAAYGPKLRPDLTEEEREAGRQRLLKHAGAVDLGHPTGADNESIDADLAREYADTHEEP